MTAIITTIQPEQAPGAEPEDFGAGPRGDALRQFVDLVGKAAAAKDRSAIERGVIKAATYFISSGFGQAGDSDLLYDLVERVLDVAGHSNDTINPVLSLLEKTLKAAGLDADAGGAGTDDRVEQPASMPDNFYMGATGIFFDTGDPEQPPIFVCSPIIVRALAHDGVETSWGFCVDVRNRYGRWRTAALPATLLAGETGELRASLIDLGAVLAPGAGPTALLKQLLTFWRPEANALTHERLGWTDALCSAFVLGDGSVIGPGTHVFSAAVSHSMASEMKTRGSLDGWRTAVGQRAEKNGILVLGISLALTGPLLEPAGADGFGLHLRGDSSSGKTTALRCATSMWGGPKFLQTWRATSNGLEGAAAAANGTCLPLDELGQSDGREAGGVAYMLANGVGKVRAGRTGAARAAITWRVVFLSSGELSLAAKMAETKAVARAGQLVRCIDIPATARKHGAFDDIGDVTASAFADRLNAGAAEQYGSAGRAFVEHLVTLGIDKIREQVMRHVAAFRARAAVVGADGQIVRVADKLGLVAAAGEMASEAGITGWSKGVATDAALRAFADWRGGFGAGNADVKAVVRAVRDHLLLHRGRFASVNIVTPDIAQRLGGKDAALTEDYALGGGGTVYGEMHGWCDSEFFYINSAAWGQIIAPLGLDADDATRHLKTAGFLAAGDGRHLRFRMPRSVPGRPRACRIPVSILGGDGGPGE
jgi:putative DNA primase/helicase